jgi:hypothetical protein
LDDAAELSVPNAKSKTITPHTNPAKKYLFLSIIKSTQV